MWRLIVCGSALGMSVVSWNDDVRSPGVVGAALSVSLTVFAAEPWTFAGSVGAVSVKPAAASGIVTFVSLNAPSSAAISAKSWLCIWPMQIGPRSTSPSGVSDSDVLTAFAAIGVSIVLPLS